MLRLCTLSARLQVAIFWSYPAKSSVHLNCMCRCHDVAHESETALSTPPAWCDGRNTVTWSNIRCRCQHECSGVPVSMVSSSASSDVGDQPEWAHTTTCSFVNCRWRTERKLSLLGGAQHVYAKLPFLSQRRKLGLTLRSHSTEMLTIDYVHTGQASRHCGCQQKKVTAPSSIFCAHNLQVFPLSQLHCCSLEQTTQGLCTVIFVSTVAIPRCLPAHSEVRPGSGCSHHHRLHHYQHHDQDPPSSSAPSSINLFGLHINLNLVIVFVFIFTVTSV